MGRRVQDEGMISVIVPVYNGADRIIRCLESIQSQKYSDFECIVIDDGSSDDSYNVIKNWIKDDRFHLYRQENAGVAIARNRGIEYANGEFIAFTDQDDYVTPEYLSHMMAVMDRDTDIVVSGYERVREDGKRLYDIALAEGEFSKFVVPTPWAHLYRKKFIIENDIHFLDSKIGEDIFFNVIAYCTTPKVKVVEHCMDYKWVDNKKSVSNSGQKTAGNDVNPLFLLNNLQREIPENGSEPEDIIEYFFIRYCVWYTLFVMRGTSKRENIIMQTQLFQWLGKTFPDYEQNKYIKVSPDGEIARYHIAVHVWMFFRKIKADRIVTGILSKK